FFFQAEDGIRDFHVTGVQTCALPISNVVGSCGLGAPPLLLLLLGALQRDHAGADELDDPERLHLADERLELALVAGDLEDERLPCDVDDPGPRSEEHTSELQSRENLV